MEDNRSIVANCSLKGKALSELVLTFREKIAGTKVYMKLGDHFPLLVKFIDAWKDFSIQVHPNNP